MAGYDDWMKRTFGPGTMDSPTAGTPNRYSSRGGGDMDQDVLRAIMSLVQRIRYAEPGAAFGQPTAQPGAPRFTPVGANPVAGYTRPVVQPPTAPVFQPPQITPGAGGWRYRNPQSAPAPAPNAGVDWTRVRR